MNNGLSWDFVIDGFRIQIGYKIGYTENAYPNRYASGGVGIPKRNRTGAQGVVTACQVICVRDVSSETAFGITKTEVRFGHKKRSESLCDFNRFRFFVVPLGLEPRTR